MPGVPRMILDRLDEWRRWRAHAAVERKRKVVAELVLRNAVKLLTNTLKAERTKVARQYGALFEHVCPGVTDALLEVEAQLSAHIPRGETR